MTGKTPLIVLDEGPTAIEALARPSIPWVGLKRSVRWHPASRRGWAVGCRARIHGDAVIHDDASSSRLHRRSRGTGVGPQASTAAVA